MFNWIPKSLKTLLDKYQEADFTIKRLIRWTIRSIIIAIIVFAIYIFSLSLSNFISPTVIRDTVTIYKDTCSLINDTSYIDNSINQNGHHNTQNIELK